MPSGNVALRNKEEDCDDDFADLAAIRRLLDTENTAGTCPSCDMPFDKGKKRRLIDNCGHERCYSCMFTNEACPLCTLDAPIIQHDTPRQQLGCMGLRGSEITLYGESPSEKDRMQPRTKVKTNGHFTTFMQGRQELTSSGVELGHPEKLPKTRPTNPRTRVDQGVMTQSCPTPPQTRRKFFLSPKALRSPFSQRTSRQPPVDSASSAAMTSSTTSNEGRHWPSVVLGKIRSLWSAGTSGPSAGLNQLVSGRGQTDLTHDVSLFF